MGNVGGTAKVDNYQMKVIGHDGQVVDPSSEGAKSAAGAGKAGKSRRREAHDKLSRNSAVVAPSKSGEDKPESGGGDAKVGHSAAKKKFLKAKAKLAAGRAFAEMGKQAERRTARKLESKCGWIAKEMVCGPSCSLNNFDVGRVIGTGLMGTVRVARVKKDDTYVALKSVRKDYITRHNDGRHVQNERRVLYDLSEHPFVVHLYGTFQDQKRVYFVMEYLAGGELFSRLWLKEKFSANVTRFYVSEIFLALEYIHDAGYCYRDLKPENVMLDEEGHCKIVDFGFARAPDVKSGLMKTNVGTPAYLSPEQLNGKFTNGYSNIVDWWSLGIITYELITGKTPFCKNNRETPYAIYLRVLKGKIKFPRNLDASAKEIIKALLVADTQKRLKRAEDIKQQPFYECVDFDAVYERRVIPPKVPKFTEPGDSHYFDDFGDVEAGTTSKPDIDQSLFVGF